MSSDWTQDPGLFHQQEKQPRQWPIFFFTRKMFSVSAPASPAPARKASTMTWVLLFSARGLPLNATIFIWTPSFRFFDRGIIDDRK